MTTQKLGVALIIGGLASQLLFALWPTENNELFAKFVFLCWGVALFGALLYVFDWLVQRVNKSK